MVIDVHASHISWIEGEFINRTTLLPKSQSRCNKNRPQKDKKHKGPLQAVYSTNNTQSDREHWCSVLYIYVDKKHKGHLPAVYSTNNTQSDREHWCSVLYIYVDKKHLPAVYSTNNTQSDSKQRTLVFSVVYIRRQKTQRSPASSLLHKQHPE